ncbi:MAG TPA: CBS domain-containing protein [Kofleriaceae bacterium]|nr:CBS domain-containing protein [Kofleriaceae bacterium]
MLCARDLMHAEPVTVPSSASLLEVQHLLVVTQIGGLPVIGPDGVVVGLVSASDVLGALEQALDEDQDEGEEEDLLTQLQAITASEVATPEVIWVSPDTPVAQVAETMRNEGIHRVLVGTRERLEGIITAFDLLRAL